MENIKDLIKQYCDYADYGYRDDYSGRGMHGRKCIGIVCDMPLNVMCDLFSYIVDSDSSIEGYDVQCVLGTPQQDSMRMSNILYFPELSTN